MKQRTFMVSSSDDLSVKKQCELLSIPRSTYYYQPIPESNYNLLLMKEIDLQYLKKPYYGRRLMTGHLRKQGFEVGEKRVSRLMKTMGLEAIYPKKKKMQWSVKYATFPYLLKGLCIPCQNFAWGTDITYIPLRGGYIYLVAVLDLFSRYVVSWKLSNSLESEFCLEAVTEAFSIVKPNIINSDQGSQYTSRAYVELVQNNGVNISMSGKGRCWDNILVERFWRSLKYEEVHISDYQSIRDAEECLGEYIHIFNNERPHSKLGYNTPAEV